MKYTTKELSTETWPDFEKLFGSPAGLVGDGWWCWCTHHHVTSYSSPENLQPRTRLERAEKNRRKKADLVQTGCAHGILVYENEEPVGWCQYGPSDELPRMNNSRNYQRLALEKRSKQRLWRITCFVIDKRHRRRGVASLALGAALDAIREKGGGLVEGFPVERTDQGSNYMYCGTVGMFQRAGFQKVAPLSNGRTSTVVMRRSL
ncbi:GNAT family N-acetyltransferase [Candidatus Bathyarchaeota archaeon]|nr:GNAT family N-acetyltransferase [Candidatus Bathyarchaeota archaeon]